MTRVIATSGCLVSNSPIMGVSYAQCSQPGEYANRSLTLFAERGALVPVGLAIGARVLVLVGMGVSVGVNAGNDVLVGVNAAVGVGVGVGSDWAARCVVAHPVSTSPAKPRTSRMMVCGFTFVPPPI